MLVCIDLHSEREITIRQRYCMHCCMILLFQARASLVTKPCRDTCNSHLPLWRSEPGIACESILPRHPMVRTNRPIRSRWRRASFLGLGQGKNFHKLLLPMGGPGAAQRSTCHIFPLNGAHQLSARSTIDWIPG
jgi:hypothetical protein